MTSDIDAALARILRSKGLSVSELRTMRPVQYHTQEGKRIYHDPVAERVMQDFQNLILHHMPAELRTRFVSAAVPHLDPGVRAISNANAKAAAFYEELAIPFVVALYGADRKSPEGRLLNARRAARRLGLDLQRDPVFLEQQEQLYRYRLVSHFERLKLYIDDQAAGTDDYSRDIEAAARDWADEIRTQFDTAGAPAGDADRTAALAHVRTAARRGQRGAFWAWAFYRELIGSVPAEFGPQALLANAQPEDAALRIKQAVTLLDTLDPSRFFSRSYLNYLHSYTTTVNLAAKVDFDGNADALADYARAALEQFAETNGTSENPQMREAAAIAGHLVSSTGPGAGNDPFGTAFRAARDAAGKLEARDFVNAVGMIAAKLTGAKIKPWLASAGAKDIATMLLKGAFGAAALGLVISGGIALDDLPARQRQRVCVGIAVSLSHSFAMLARGTAHTVGFFAEHGVAWSNLSHSWGQWKAFDAQAVYTRGFAGWILRNKEGSLRADAHWGEQARSLAMPGARYDYGHDRIKVSRLFGRNLDEFMAYRVGAVIGAINLYFALSSFRDASQPLDVAASAVSTAGAAFGLIGSAGGWICSAFGRFALAGQLSSAMSMLTFAATIIVVAIVVWQIVKKRENTSELRRFAQNEAAQAGYYMPLGAAIEHIAPTDPGEGVTARTADGRFLHIDGDGAVVLAAKATGAQNVFAAAIDAAGRAQLATPGAAPGPGPAATWVLVADDDRVRARRREAGQEPAFCWAFGVQGGLVWADDGQPAEKLRSARVEILVSGLKTPRYLAAAEGGIVLSDTPFPWTVEPA